MDQQQLTDRLERQVADLQIGPPPVDAMRTAARRRRDRRTAVLATMVAVAVIATGATVWQSAAPDPQPPLASESPSTDPDPDPDLPPGGYGYLGIGAAVIAVPGYWNSNELQCGTPVKDTVIIDLGAICLMAVPRPADVESIEIRTSPMPETADTWTPFEIDGEPALRSPVLSTSGTETVTSASVYLPDRQVLFVAESSSADAAEWVERKLDSITILEAHTTVPGFNDLAFDSGSAVDDYLERLQALGLAAEVSEMRSPLEPGTVLATSPLVGSVMAPGDTVQVMVAR